MSKRIALVLVGLLSIAGVLYLVWPAAADGSVAQVRKKLEQRFPDVPIKRVTPAVWPGMYEVIAGSDVVYTNAGADWMIMGQMVDLKTRENLTTKGWDDFMRVDYGALPFDKAIKVVKGSGSRHMAVFEDPFCPYCAELEKTLREFDDLTIHVFLYPLENVHPGASIAAERIWCAPDRAQAWIKWMADSAEPPASQCTDTPMAELGKLGTALHVEQTPTLFFPDGSRISGAADKATIERQLMRQASPPKAAASAAVTGASAAANLR